MRILKALAVMAVVLAGPLLGAVPAGAATPACQAAAVLCGNWVTPVSGGVALDVYQQGAASDTPVIVWRQGDDPAEDFVLISGGTTLTSAYPSLADKETLTATSVYIEYDPLREAIRVLRVGDHQHRAGAGRAASLRCGVGGQPDVRPVPDVQPGDGYRCGRVVHGVRTCCPAWSSTTPGRAGPDPGDLVPARQRVDAAAALGSERLTIRRAGRAWCRGRSRTAWGHHS